MVKIESSGIIPYFNGNHTNSMPIFFKNQIIFCAAMILLILAAGMPAITTASDGIDHYYIRYDVKSSKNKIIDERLTMVPANNEFRGENFSLLKISRAISADPGESPKTLDRLGQKHALQWILETKGLKSVKTQDHDTVISYEGMVITPISLVILPYDPDLGGYPYTAQIQFAPIAFPDQWGPLKLKHRIKEIFHDFFTWFK